MNKTLIRLLSLLLVAVFACMAVACNGNDPTHEGMQKVTTPDNAEFYNLYVPQNWTSQASGGISGARVSDIDRSNVTVTLYFPDESQTAESYWQNHCLPSYNQVLGSVTTDAENCKDTVLGGMDAKQYVFTYQLDGVTYKVLQVITVKNELVYTLTFTAVPTADVTAEQRFEQHKETVESIISVFTFA